MTNFKTFSPLIKIRLTCALNILISVVSLILYVWIDESIKDKFSILISAFIGIILVLITMFFVRTIMVNSRVYGSESGLFITEDGKVYGRESLFLQFPLSLFLVFILLSQFPIMNLEKIFVWGSLAVVVIINFYNLIHLPWVYKNFPHLELPKNNTKA